MSRFESIIETDLQWREAELATLLALAAMATGDELRTRAIRRSRLALLYAHFEGFCKFAWESYVLEVSRDGALIGQLNDRLKFLFCEESIRKMKNAGPEDIISRALELCFKFSESRKTFSQVANTSNLWPEEFERISENLGLTCSYIDDHRQNIKALVSRRNDIAHGKDVEVNEESLLRLTNSAWLVMIALALDLIDCIDKRKFVVS